MTRAILKSSAVDKVDRISDVMVAEIFSDVYQLSIGEYESNQVSDHFREKSCRQRGARLEVCIFCMRMREKMAMVVGLMHSILASGTAIMLLPLLWKIDGVWLGLPLAEFLTALVGFLYISKHVNPRL